MISDLLAFLNARLDEDEARAKDDFVCEPIAVKARALREVAAKRQILERAEFVQGHGPSRRSRAGDGHDNRSGHRPQGRPPDARRRLQRPPGLPAGVGSGRIFRCPLSLIGSASTTSTPGCTTA